MNNEVLYLKWVLGMKHVKLILGKKKWDELKSDMVIVLSNGTQPQNAYNDSVNSATEAAMHIENSATNNIDNPKSRSRKRKERDEMSKQ